MSDQMDALNKFVLAYPPGGCVTPPFFFVDTRLNKSDVGSVGFLIDFRTGIHSSLIHLVKDDEIQIEGQITASCHGVHHINMKNGMKALATARKLDTYLRLSLLDGDKIVVSISPASLSSSDEKLRGWIIWTCID